MLFLILRDKIQIGDEDGVEAGVEKFGAGKRRETLLIESVLKMFKLYC